MTRVPSLDDHATALVMLEAVARFLGGVTRAQASRLAGDTLRHHADQPYSVAACQDRLETLGALMEPDPVVTDPPALEPRAVRIERARQNRRDRLRNIA